MLSDTSDELDLVLTSLKRFIDTEVVPLEQANKALLFDERETYDNSGRYVGAVLDLRREVRRRSYNAGFYTMFGSEALGGGGMGAVAGARVQQLLWREYGPSRLLIHTVVLPSPFTNGLTPVLEFLAEDLRPDYLPSI